MEHDFKTELDNVVELVKEMEGWRDFVDSLTDNPYVNELFAESELDLEQEQLAAFTLWRLTSISVSDSGDIENEFDEQLSSEEENGDDLLLFALRVWKEQVLEGELLQSEEFITFQTLADMMKANAPRSREESEGIWNEFLSERSSEVILQDPIQPLPDSEVDSLLRRRRGQGLTDYQGRQ